MVGVLSLVAGYINAQPVVRNDRFVRECVQSCEIGAGEAGFCANYCQCSLEQIDGGDLWEAITVAEPTEAQHREVNQVVNLCSAMAREAAPGEGN